MADDNEKAICDYCEKEIYYFAGHWQHSKDATNWCNVRVKPRQQFVPMTNLLCE